MRITIQSARVDQAVPEEALSRLHASSRLSERQYHHADRTHLVPPKLPRGAGVQHRYDQAFLPNIVRGVLECR
jgi:hypothetical protein